MLANLLYSVRNMGIEAISGLHKKIQISVMYSYMEERRGKDTQLAVLLLRKISTAALGKPSLRFVFKKTILPPLITSNFTQNKADFPNNVCPSFKEKKTFEKFSCSSHGAFPVEVVLLLARLL